MASQALLQARERSRERSSRGPVQAVMTHEQDVPRVHTCTRNRRKNTEGERRRKEKEARGWPRGGTASAAAPRARRASAPWEVASMAPSGRECTYFGEMDKRKDVHGVKVKLGSLTHSARSACHLTLSLRGQRSEHTSRTHGRASRCVHYAHIVGNSYKRTHNFKQNLKLHLPCLRLNLIIVTYFICPYLIKPTLHF